MPNFINTKHKTQIRNYNLFFFFLLTKQHTKQNKKTGEVLFNLTASGSILQRAAPLNTVMTNTSQIDTIVNFDLSIDDQLIVIATKQGFIKIFNIEFNTIDINDNNDNNIDNDNNQTHNINQTQHYNVKTKQKKTKIHLLLCLFCVMHQIFCNPFFHTIH